MTTRHRNKEPNCPLKAKPQHFDPPPRWIPAVQLILSHDAVKNHGETSGLSGDPGSVLCQMEGNIAAALLSPNYITDLRWQKTTKLRSGTFCLHFVKLFDTAKI